MKKIKIIEIKPDSLVTKEEAPVKKISAIKDLHLSNEKIESLIKFRQGRSNEKN